MRDRVHPPQFVDPHAPGAAEFQFADRSRRSQRKGSSASLWRFIELTGLG
jgi:hypothetical protein